MNKEEAQLEAKNSKAYIPKGSVPAGRRNLAKINRIFEKGLTAYCSAEEPWNHNFDEEARSYSCHDEASYLSKYIFARLFECTTGLLGESYTFGDPVKLNYRTGSYLAVEWGKNQQELLLRFDVMNNPKPDGGNIHRLGVMTENRLSFEEHYHTIGNFTPVPWWIENTCAGTHTNNLQSLHNSLAEWWDALLYYLQWRMPSFAEESGMSFEDYIILTCQFFYIDFGDELLLEFRLGNLDACEFCKKIKESDSDFPWTKQVKEWARKLKDPKCKCKVISFAKLFRANEEDPCFDPAKQITWRKETHGHAFKRSCFDEEVSPILDELRNDSERIDELDKYIAKLIEVRGRCILGLLQEAQKQKAKNSVPQDCCKSPA